MTSLCVGLNMEDNIYACAAVLHGSIVFENHDGYLPPVFVYCGDEAVLSDSGKEIFRGRVIEVGVTGRQGVFSFTAYEDSHRLAKNDVYGIFSSSAAANARKAIEQAGLSADELPYKICRAFACYGGMTAKEVIDECYGDGYYVDMRNGKAGVYKVGHDEVGLSNEAVFDIVSKSSVGDMVNFVSLTNSKHSVIYNTKSNDNINKYGKYHKYYQISKNVSPAGYAEAAMRGIVDKADVTVTGDLGLSKGCLVSFDLERYGLSGKYLIESVRHTVTGGVFTSEIGVIKYGSLL